MQHAMIKSELHIQAALDSLRMLYETALLEGGGSQILIITECALCL